MGSLLVWTSALALLAAIGCDSRTLSGRPGGTQAGPRNFGFFPSFAATIPRVAGRHNPLPPPFRRRRSARSPPSDEGNPETDVLEVDDFLATNGLGGRGDEGADGDSWQEGLEHGSDHDVPWSTSDDNRLKRADEEVNGGNNLSWLLEQDLWEKVDDADALDWDNIGKEEFEAADEAESRDTRDTGAVGGGKGGDSRVREDAVYQTILKIAEDLEKKRREEIESENKVGEEGGEESVGGDSSAKHSDVGDSAPREDYEVEDDYLDESMKRRRRSAESDVSVVDVEGRIDMVFKSPPESPVATVIIQKDPAPPNPPEISPPIYFCGTKTDPNNTDSVSGEVYETVATH